MGVLKSLRGHRFVKLRQTKSVRRRAVALYVHVGHQGFYVEAGELRMAKYRVLADAEDHCDFRQGNELHIIGLYLLPLRVVTDGALTCVPTNFRIRFIAILCHSLSRFRDPPSRALVCIKCRIRWRACAASSSLSPSPPFFMSRISVTPSFTPRLFAQSVSAKRAPWRAVRKRRPFSFSRRT